MADGTLSNTGLHEVSAEKLLPLLSQHLPYSLSVLATIQQKQLSPSLASSGSGKYLGLNVAFTTFPDGSVPDRDDDAQPWVVICSTDNPYETHVRMYCSAENPAHQSSSLSDEILQPFMSEVSRDLVKIFGREGPSNGIFAGAVHTRWDEAVRRWVGGERKDLCTVFLAPLVTHQSEADEAAPTQDVADTLDRLGLGWDVGREHDAKIIRATCDIPRPHEYYQSRTARTTVLRQLAPAGSGASFESQPAVCWVLTHSDGALGALYTLPPYRRKGLAKLVTRQRLASAAQRPGAEGERGFCHVMEGNKASERLWESMGWEKGWLVRWIYETHREETGSKHVAPDIDEQR